MNRTHEYKPVNWVNGMKINKNHFIAQQYATQSQQALSNTVFLNDHNYGLLPISTTIEPPKIWVTVDNMQQVSVRILACTAITRGGYVIRFSSDSTDSANPLSARIPGLSVPFKELKGKADEYYVIISVDPYNPVPTGVANPEEQPIRLPFTEPAYTVSLLPVAETSLNTLGAFQLPVGKVIIRDQTVALEEDYIAPCTSINSHGSLVQHHAETEQFFGRMELNALQILQKILQKNQQNDLIDPVRKLSEQVLFYISQVYGNYRHSALFGTPVELITVVSGLARTIKNAIDIYIGSAKEEMINYFTEWCNVNQGELEDEITDITNYRYDHLNIRQGIDKNVKFCALILQLFTNLAALDYIGKKKETGIFVKEKLIVPEEEVQARKRGFFLAD
ncbi:MAG: hypothetical protein J7539_16460 [Niabella sp.]|nr:hypothetical protein [Niabella sp.]